MITQQGICDLCKSLLGTFHFHGPIDQLAAQKLINLICIKCIDNDQSSYLGCMLCNVNIGCGSVLVKCNDKYIAPQFIVQLICIACKFKYQFCSVCYCFLNYSNVAVDLLELENIGLKNCFIMVVKRVVCRMFG